MHGVTSGELFIEQLDSQGSELWRIQTDALVSDRYQGLSVDASGNITLLGVATAGTSVTGPPMVDGSFFAAMLAPDGQQRWLRVFDVDDYWQLGGVASDDQGNVFITGQFKGTLQTDIAPLVSAGGFDAFLLGLDSDGNGTFSRRFGNAAADEVGSRVAADGQGGAVMTGTFTGSVDLTAEILSAPGERGGFVASFNASGTVRWARAIHGVSATIVGFDELAVAVGEDGDILVGGQFEGSSNVTVPALSNGDYDGMMLRYASNGNRVWGYAFGDANSDIVQAVAVGPGPHFALLGQFWGGPDLGNGHLASHADGSMFIALYDADAK